MKIAVLSGGKNAGKWREGLADALPILEAKADLAPVDPSDSAAATAAIEDADAAIVVNPFTLGELAAIFDAVQRPVMVIYKPLMWHPYCAQARPFFAGRGIPILPTDTAEQLDASLTALAARERLRSERILAFLHGSPEAQHAAASRLGAKLGTTIELRPVQQLKSRAAAVGHDEAKQVLARWREEVFASVHPNVTDEHLQAVAKLYVAEKALAAEAKATALTVEEFGPFLFQDEPMPNVTYAILKNEGVLTAEEGDWVVLATQLLLQSLTGESNTMSNIYLAWRDRYEAIGSPGEYTIEMERADFRQCVADSKAVISHFGSAGSLPRCMMDAEKYDVIETTPPWPGQAMLMAPPKLGPLVLARLRDDGRELDAYAGEGVEVLRLDRDDWNRMRWMVRMDVAAFVEHAFHHHWAVASPPDDRALDVLCGLLGVSLRRF